MLVQKRVHWFIENTCSWASKIVLSRQQLAANSVENPVVRQPMHHGGVSVRNCGQHSKYWLKCISTGKPNISSPRLPVNVSLNQSIKPPHRDSQTEFEIRFDEILLSIWEVLCGEQQAVDWKSARKHRCLCTLSMFDTLKQEAPQWFLLVYYNPISL